MNSFNNRFNSYRKTLKNFNKKKPINFKEIFENQI